MEVWGTCSPVHFSYITEYVQRWSDREVMRCVFGKRIWGARMPTVTAQGTSGMPTSRMLEIASCARKPPAGLPVAAEASHVATTEWEAVSRGDLHRVAACMLALTWSMGSTPAFAAQPDFDIPSRAVEEYQALEAKASTHSRASCEGMHMHGCATPCMHAHTLIKTCVFTLQGPATT